MDTKWELKKRTKSREEYFKELFYEISYKDEGLVYIDYKYLKIQREIPPNMLQQVIRNLAEGKKLLNFHFPIINYSPYTKTDDLINDLRILSHFAQKALYTKDPLEKMKIIVTYAIANKQIFGSNKIPLPPIIG